MSEKQFKKVRWECTDCSLGEQSKCVYEGLLEYEDETPPQCPQDEHGCDAAKWVRVSTCPPVDSVGVDMPASCEECPVLKHCYWHYGRHQESGTVYKGPMCKSLLFDHFASLTAPADGCEAQPK